MKKTRFLSLFLSLSVVLTALALPAGAAGAAPTMTITNPGTNAQTLSLHDLPADCYGLQVTLELDRQLDNAAFVFADSLPTAGAYDTYQKDVPGEGNITLYLTTKAAFSQGDLVLGTLSSNEAFHIEAVSDLKLLVGSGSNVETVSYETVTVEKNTGSSSSGPVITRYAISVPKFENGSVMVSHTSAAAGSVVTATAHPNVGYLLDELTVTSRAGAKIALTDKGDGVFTFVMPSGAVELQASFTPVEVDPPDETQDPVVVPFTDVQPGDWFYDAVEYVYAHGLMTGTSNDIFSPNAITSRGMIVTILHRLEGGPSAGTSAFEDVELGQWYTDAVNWAAANDIVNGYDSRTFAPNDTITREQMATILYRYAEYKGYDVTAQADLSIFPDMGQVSSYAVEAMQWAVAEKLIQGTSVGTSTILAPSGSAVRSQSATLLKRFCENIAG